jgi:hypothetical protein
VSGDDSPIGGEDHFVHLGLTHRLERVTLSPCIVLIDYLHEPAGSWLILMERPTDHEVTMCEITGEEGLEL